MIKMLQEILAYISVSAAVLYMGRKLLQRFRKEEACDKCELMKAAKK
jgi:hypothetical protein